MTFEFIDRNTYIQRPIYETKDASSKLDLKDVKVLTNNTESIRFVPSSAPVISQPADYYLLIDYVEKTPVLSASIDALVNDEISGYEFEPIGDKENTTLIKHAYDFAEANNLLYVLRQMDNDKYIYGNGYLAISRVNDFQIKQMMNTDGYECKDYEFKEMRQFVDELSYKNVKLAYLPSTTVSIYVDDIYGEVVKYKQVVNQNSLDFDKADILHFKDLDYDGKLFGYSRIYGLKSEIQTIWNIKDYLGKFFDNNGTPDLLFIAPKMIPKSPQHEDFKAQLKDMKKMDNKRKNLLSTSDLKIERLNDINNNMPFQDLLNQYMSEISLAYDVPPTRIGLAPSGAGEGLTLTNQGYYRNVASKQEYIENILNTQLFIPLLGVRIRLKKDYKEDEQRDAAINKSKLDQLEQLLRNKLIKREDAGRIALNLLGLKGVKTPTDDEVLEEQEQEMETNIQYMQGQQSKTDLSDEPKKNANKNKTPKKYK